MPTLKFREELEKVNIFNSAPGTSEAIQEFHRTIQGIARDIGTEYSRVYSEDGRHQTGDGSDSPKGAKPGSTVFSTPAQQREMRE